LRRANTIKCTCGLIVTTIGLDLYSYHVHELLVSLAVFTVAYLVLALTALAAVFLWWSGEQLANRTGPASRRVIAFSRRLIAAYARP
jgi:hypothetical protein